VPNPEAAARELTSAIAAAIDDLCDDLERYQARQEQRRRLTACIVQADRLIEDLEGLSLAERPVPSGWQRRLDRFAGQLPPGMGAALRAGDGPMRLVHQVTGIEEELFRLRLGEWAQAFEEDP
jgi:hypothetical protein